MRHKSYAKFINEAPDLNPIEHLWYVVEWELRALDVHPTSLLTVRCYPINMGQHF